MVDVIVKLDTCEIHVTAKLASLSCMHTPTVQLPGQQLSATADSDSRPTVSDSVRQMSDSVRQSGVQRTGRLSPTAATPLVHIPLCMGPYPVRDPNLSRTPPCTGPHPIQGRAQTVNIPAGL